MSNLSALSLLPAQLVNYVEDPSIPKEFDDSNALFFYQDLTQNRMPSMLMVQYENMNSSERSQALRQRFMLQWFLRLAHEKSNGAEFRNLFAIYVFRNTLLGDSCARNVKMMSSEDHIMPNNDSVQGILWIQLKEDRCKVMSDDMKKYFGMGGRKQKRRKPDTTHRSEGSGDEGGGGADGNESDEAEEEDAASKITAAARVMAYSDIQRKILTSARGSNSKSSPSAGFQNLAMMTPLDTNPFFTLRGEGDFSILVGIPTAAKTYLARHSNDNIQLSAWSDPDRFFTFKLAHEQIPADATTPGDMFLRRGDGTAPPPVDANGAGPLVENVSSGAWYVKNRDDVFNLWSVDLEYFWMNDKNSGAIMFKTALFAPVVKRSVAESALPIFRAPANMHDPYARSRLNKFGLLPPAMENVYTGFSELKAKLMEQKHGGFYLHEIETMVREYLENEYTIGTLFQTPRCEQVIELKATQEQIKTNVRLFIEEYGRKRKMLVLDGLVKVNDALTPLTNAPLSTSSWRLGMFLEQQKTEMIKRPDMLETVWTFPPYRFVNLTLYQHAYAYMLDTMSLLNLYNLHTLAPLFYLAMASLPWERTKALMPLHLLLVGQPGLGKSYFIETIKSLSFDGLTVDLTSLSTKFFAAKPSTNCFEGALAGRTMILSELNPDMFNTKNGKNKEQATYMKTILTEQTLGVNRLEKNPDTELFGTSEFTIGNYCAFVAASNSPIGDSAISDRFVTVAPQDMVRSDGLKAVDCKSSTMVCDEMTQEQMKQTYQMTSATLGYIQHAMAAGVLERIDATSVTIQEKIYEKEVMKMGGMKNPNRTSNVLHRISAHAALHGAVTAVFRGNAKFVPPHIRLPNNAECILHVEALAAVPADLDQTLHFTALQTKNFNPLLRTGMQMLATAMLGFDEPTEEDLNSLKFVNNSEGLHKLMRFAKHPEGVMSMTDPASALFNGQNWIFVPLVTSFGAAQVFTDGDVMTDDFFTFDSNNSMVEIDRLATAMHTFLNDNSTKHSLMHSDLEYTKHIFRLMHKNESASKQLIRAFSIGTSKGKTTHFVFNADEMILSLQSDIIQHVAQNTRHCAMPKGTMLITGPQSGPVNAQKISTYHVAKPQYVDIPWHDSSCVLMSTPESAAETNDICEKGVQSRRPLRSTYNADFWRIKGCTCFRSKIITVKNEQNIMKSRQVWMRLNEDARIKASQPLKRLRYPIEITQFFTKMVTLGYNPFDKEVQNKYHPMYNTKTWFSDDGVYKFTEDDELNYPQNID